MPETQSSVKEVIPEIGGNFPLDEGVIAVLPSGSRVLECSSFGTSAWTRTARILVQSPDGSSRQYFLKCATEGGRIMMEGEFNSMSELYKLAPSFVPRPHAWGKFERASPVTHFFLCDFIDMETEMPEPIAFCARLAEIHLNSQSPTGQFGFMVPNCHGKILQGNGWDPSWRSFFTKLLVSFFEIEVSINGPWEEYQQAFEVVVSTVIPQLLDPLQADGRTLKPCLVHGDLWEENAAINLATGDPVVFDASAFYAHNEYELGTWRRETIKFGKSHFNQYLRNVHPSEPADQWDDRVRLYSLKFNLAHMIGWPGAPFVREEYDSPNTLR
ncbi:MAG: hypothetical protein L6R40_008416 [Gallowayella cf. fulva]|nr:MAG: hypothetical protein L6R40_008416 [Xanthomendoza cf. fulva]